MKKYLLALSIFGLSASTFAATEKFFSPEVQDRNAYDVCSRIQDDQKALACLDVIEGNYFSQTALWYCDILEMASPTIDCLRNTANRYLQDDAAIACSRITDDGKAVLCVTTIADRRYSRNKVKYCDGLSTAYATISCFDR